MITLLALFIRPWAINWKNGLSDIRDWLIPAITFVAFLTLDYRDWRKWVGLFLIVLYLNASVGIYQSLTNSGRPYVNELSIYKKDVYFIGENVPTRASFAAGFYAHPNQFGLYVFMGLMVALGFLTGRKELHWAKYLLLIPIGLALYWSYSKASLLVTVVALGLWLLHRLIESDKLFLKLLIGGAIIGPIAAVIIAPFLPPAMLGTFWWRVDLWQVALETISQQPTILLFGNGKDIYAQEAIHPQPHSLYVFMLLQYGLLGLLLTCAIIGRFCQLGWQARRSGLMKEHPILAGLWIALFGFFLISLVETTWLTLLNRLFFVIIVSLFLGLYQQLQHQELSFESLP
jgi:O-antigen ligase